MNTRIVAAPSVRPSVRSNGLIGSLFSTRLLRFYFFLILAGFLLLRFLIAATQATNASLFVVPQASGAFIRQIPLAANDVVYSPSTHLLYASVPSSVGTGGNSIKTIDPATGAITNSTFVGSEPNRLALADDGTTLYAALNGSFAVRRFDISTQTAGLQFSLGNDSFFGRFVVNDLAVQPGNPNVVAVARYYQGVSPPEAGVAVFDSGVQRPNTGPGHIAGSDFIAFSTTPSTLYGGGTSGGVRTMTIDANGVTVISTGPFSVGTRIKFDNGLIFSSTGQVISASSGNLLGTFSGASSNAFVADSTVGRAYYLTTGQFGSPGPLTLRAYDINTFVPVGTLTIPNIVGTPTTLIRWGNNGLAFRTTANEFYLIQTSLIPSADPIPSPTATPSPTQSPSPSPFPAFSRLLSLSTNDLILRPSDQMLYVSVPSSGGSTGNSVKQIDPVAGTITASFFVGSEPTKLAQADDGQTAYVFLNGAGAIRKLNLSALTAGNQFAVGLDNFNGVYSASDLAVAPGNPDLVGIARQFPNVSPSEAGVAVFDNGVQRTKTGPGHIDGPDFIIFESPTKLYGVGGFRGLTTMTVDSTGVTVTGSVPFGGGFGGIKLNNGLIYGASGQVIEAATGKIQGTYSLGSGFSASTFAIDLLNNRIFFMAQSFSSNYQLSAFNLDDFLPIGTATVPGISGTPGGLVRWGTNGLAFRTTSNQVFLVQTTLVNSSDPLPAATPTPSPTPSPSPPYIPTFVRRVSLAANSLVYSTDTQALYASVPSSAGANGNSITGIVPESGAIGPSTFVGSEPNKMALSDDGKTLWVNLTGANAIRRVDVPTLTAGLQFTTTSQPAADMEVLPGNASALAVSRGNVVIYDDGVQRPNASASFPSVGPIEFGASAATLYGYNSGSTGFDLVKYDVSSSGLSNVRSTGNLLTGFNNSLKFSNGLLYSGSGRVADPEALKLAGTFQGTGSSSGIAIDSTSGRAFFVAGSGSNVVLSAFDINTFLPLGSVTLPGLSGTPTNLVRWGTNGLAFNLANPPGDVVILQSALVSNSGAIPTGIQLNSNSIFTFESVGSLVVTVNRTGDVSATTTVDYTTSDGTATAGSDYTATSGTLVFTAGQLSRTILIPIINDNLYEGVAETLNITLSNPNGGAILSSPISATISISDDDSKPSISIPSTLRLSEGNTGTTNVAFTVSLSNPSVQTLTVDYTTADGTAQAGSDFVSTSGTLIFLPGTTTGTVNVSVNGDTSVEPDETFFVRLSNAVNASFISNSQDTATIQDDDGIKLALDTSGPGFNQALAFDSVLLVRDPFRVLSIAQWLNLGTDRNTRLTVVALNLTLNAGETASAVTITLDSGNQSRDIVAEDVRALPNSIFTQITFRLPDNLPAGTYQVTIKAHGQTSNTGTIRIAS